MARTLVKVRQKVPVRAFNATYSDQKLKRGSPITHCDPVTLVTTLDLEQPHAGHLSSKLEGITEAARPHLSSGELQDLEVLLAKYKYIFAVYSEDYGQTNKVYHCIDMGDARPIRQPPRRLPLAKQAEVREMLYGMQCHGVIEESNSPWSSPVVLVMKRNGELRFCVDYRKLNNVTKKDCFPLPRIDDPLRHAGWDLNGSPLSILKAGIGKYMCTRVTKTKWLLNWSRVTAVQSSLWPLQRSGNTLEDHGDGPTRTHHSCLVYLDDVIIIGCTFKEHLLNLQKVFQRF
jgi:hypothetical protein